MEGEGFLWDGAERIPLAEAKARYRDCRPMATFICRGCGKDLATVFDAEEPGDLVMLAAWWPAALRPGHDDDLLPMAMKTDDMRMFVDLKNKDQRVGDWCEMRTFAVYGSWHDPVAPDTRIEVKCARHGIQTIRYSMVTEAVARYRRVPKRQRVVTEPTD